MDSSILPTRLPPSRLLIPGFGFGLVMISIGVVIAYLRGDDLPRIWYPAHNIPLEIVFGILAGLSSIGLVVLTMRFMPSLGSLLDELLAKIRLEDVTIWQAAAFGLMAGIPEEILFRGGIQPTLGLPLTALLFGLVHAISPKYMFYATIAGLCLGGLAAWRGDLWAATAAHFAYDAGMFIYIAWQVRHRNNAILESKQAE